MGRSRDPDRDLRRDLDELGFLYLQALSLRDARAHDGGFVRTTTNLDILLAILGWRPADPGTGT